ncbi:MAG: AEC family transporter, partial [Pseudomonadota bacterium]|nr:AEC family transporter [Pseudomonadota bacterium]
MADILALTIPFFGIILLGSLTRLKGWFSAADGRMISRYVFFVVLPPFMFVAITARPLNDIFNPEFTLRYELVTFSLFVIAFCVGRYLLRLSRKEAGLFGLNASYPNYGYIGVPLALLAFGEAAAVPMAVILVVNNTVLVFLVALFTTDEASGSAGSTFARTLVSLVKNPLLMSVVVAMGFSASGLTMPEMPALFLDLLAGAAAPTALFALGIALVGQPVRAAWGELGALALFKLFVHPLMMALVFLGWPAIGPYPFDPLWIKIALIFSCLPVAANVFNLAEFYSVYSGRTATSIMLSTLIASVSVPAMMYMV